MLDIDLIKFWIVNPEPKQRIEYIEKEKPYLISLYELDKIQLKNRIDFLKKIELEKLSIDFKPIFVMGMVRSGTTLNEMILSNHKDVTGCGEIDFLKEKLELFKYVFNNKRARVRKHGE